MATIIGQVEITVLDPIPADTIYFNISVDATLEPPGGSVSWLPNQLAGADSIKTGIPFNIALFGNNVPSGGGSKFVVTGVQVRAE